MAYNYIREKIIRSAYAIKGDKRFGYYDYLVNNLQLTEKEMYAKQCELIQRIVKYAYENTRFYRRLMDERGVKCKDIQNREDLKKLPPVNKSLIKENLENIKTQDEYSKNLTCVTSGGSTGNLATIFKSKYYIEYSRAASLRNNLIVGWAPCDRSVWIWGAPYENQKVKSSIISRLGIMVNGRLLFNAYQYSERDFLNWVKSILKFKPKFVYGYASIILQFSRYLLDEQIELSGIRAVVSTTETLKEREIIKKAFGCPVYNQYGCREILAVGIESSQDVMRIADDVVALNIGADDSILLTALHSYGFPLINYKVGDYGIIEKIKQKENGNDDLPFTKMHLTIGRTTDNFINNRNEIISSSALSTYISTFKMPVKEFQMIQYSQSEFKVNLVPENGFEKNKCKIIINGALKKYFGNTVHVSYHVVEKLMPEKSGKRLMFKRLFQYE